MLDRLKAWNDDQRIKARARADAAAVKLQAARQPASFAGVRIEGDHLVAAPTMLHPKTMPGDEPIAGVTATVDVSGGVGGRATLTRSALPGLHGWQKKIDTREAQLVIDGPTFQWVVPLRPTETDAARTFAALVTTVGRQAAASSSG